MTHVPPVGRAGSERDREVGDPSRVDYAAHRNHRARAVDRPLGYPLGEPNQPELQKRIVQAALARPVSEPLIVPYMGSPR